MSFLVKVIDQKGHILDEFQVKGTATDADASIISGESAADEVLLTVVIAE